LIRKYIPLQLHGKAGRHELNQLDLNFGFTGVDASAVLPMLEGCVRPANPCRESLLLILAADPCR